MELYSNQPDASEPGRSLKRNWRDMTRRTLIVSWISHKGGQGRTLGCAHVALELVRRATDPRNRHARANILLVDFDWGAPSLTYMFDDKVLPRGYSVTRDTNRSSIGLLK